MEIELSQWLAKTSLGSAIKGHKKSILESPEVEENIGLQKMHHLRDINIDFAILVH